MRRLLALTVVVTLAAVGAGTAQAHHLTGSPVINAGTGAVTDDVWAELIDRAVRPAPPGGSPITQTEIDTRVTRLRRAGRILPKIRVLGPLALGASAFSVGWAIGSVAQPTFYQLITGDIGTQPGGNAEIASMKWVSNSGIPWSGIDTPGEPSGGYYYRLRTDSCVLFYDPPHASFGCADDVDNAAIATLATFGTRHHHTSATFQIAGTATEAQMEDALEVQTVSQATYDAFPGTKVGTSGTPQSYTIPGDLGTSADKLAAGEALGGSGTQTAVQEATEEALCTSAGLSGCAPPPETFVLPQPTVNETYAAYILRLEALGWIGTATTTVTITEHAGYGPEAPVRIIVTESGATTTRTIDPLAWPGAAVTVDNDTDITIRYNPETAPEAPGETGSIPGTPSVYVTLPPTTVPTGPEIDFSPITTLDGACSFPFGFICYAQEVTAEFDVAADAPVFSFDIAVPALMGGGTVAYVVDLDILDDYMAIIRGLIAFALWIGAVYWLAVNLLGFRGGGDPGEAADEALHV